MNIEAIVDNLREFRGKSVVVNWIRSGEINLNLASGSTTDLYRGERAHPDTGNHFPHVRGCNIGFFQSTQIPYCFFAEMFLISTRCK